MYDRDGTIRPIQYLFGTINMYMTLGFKIKNFGFQQQSECFGLIFTVHPINASAKAKWSPV